MAVDAFRKEDEETKIFLGITFRDINNKPDSVTNRFVLSDGTDFDDTDYLYQWGDGKPGYTTFEKCAYLGNDGKIVDVYCRTEGKALCAVESTCPSSGSERSRANLPIFALFVAGSVFNAFHALAGLYF